MFQGTVFPVPDKDYARTLRVFDWTAQQKTVTVPDDEVAKEYGLSWAGMGMVKTKTVVELAKGAEMLLMVAVGDKLSVKITGYNSPTEVIVKATKVSWKGLNPVREEFSCLVDKKELSLFLEL